MCAGGNIMEKTLTEATKLLQRISEGVAMQRDWEELISGSVEQETCVEVLAGISRKEAPKVKKRSLESEERRSKARKRFKGQPTMKEDQSKASKFASSKSYKEEVW
jgi:hypothetical protein